MSAIPVFVDGTSHVVASLPMAVPPVLHHHLSSSARYTLGADLLLDIGTRKQSCSHKCLSVGSLIISSFKSPSSPTLRHVWLAECRPNWRPRYLTELLTAYCWSSRSKIKKILQLVLNRNRPLTGYKTDKKSTLGKHMVTM